MCMNVLPAYMCVYLKYTLSSQKAEKDIGSPGTEITYCSGLLYACWESNPGLTGRAIGTPKC